ncbi:MAG TPA: PfkB family carbohydrate kinase [Ktedonobacterales bacterium]|jgi:sugar/nucleoside kinase (ribokinase family)
MPPRAGRPDYLVIGHATRDLRPDGGWRVGGTVVFAAAAAARLGLRAAIVTAAPPDVLAAIRHAAPDVELAALPTPTATTFANRYLPDGRRRQYLRSRAPMLGLDAVPDDWRACAIVHLAPVAAEVDGALAAAFPGALLGATPQGWLRAWGGTGLVRPAAWREAARVLPHLRALVLSQDDLATDAASADAAIARWARTVPVVVVTRGAAGADLLAQGSRVRVPAFPAREVDPTGAGDVFAAALFVALAEGEAPAAAVRFANAAAAFVVEQPGVAGLPDRAAVLARLGGA